MESACSGTRGARREAKQIIVVIDVLVEKQNKTKQCTTKKTCLFGLTEEYNDRNSLSALRNYSKEARGEVCDFGKGGMCNQAQNWVEDCC